MRIVTNSLEFTGIPRTPEEARHRGQQADHPGVPDSLPRGADLPGPPKLWGFLAWLWGFGAPGWLIANGLGLGWLRLRFGLARGYHG